MKKEYGTPKVEKVTFDYSEVVLATSSATICTWVQEDGNVDQGCNQINTQPGHFNEAAH